ncbi:hypothetical protein K469DRAFT_640064 [Zopfia rhizophila CBS 207.26]|uniref:Peptide hydrolase n=1 Tax=Zopfia rhizophila CBS 207.26 TaxID=1314779 RepID=A0A6A6DPU9_9PEZI|nr:hypothetical protein K469DRAFT_640064 [Zopfia rhizophila CBS 207.26]
MKGAVAIAALAATTSASPYFSKRQANEAACKRLPLVDSKALQDSIKPEALLKGAQALQDFAYAHPERNRLFGGAGHNDTVNYLVEELEALDGYYKVEKQEWHSLAQVNGTASLLINGTDYNPNVMEYSPSGNVTAPIVVVNNLGCNSSDYPSTVRGNIALISRGTCEFGLKSVLAGQAGAAGAIVYNNAAGSLNGTLGPPRPQGPYIPTVFIAGENGTALRTALTGGASLIGDLDTWSLIENRTTYNVLATSNCGALNTTLMLGAHTDSVAEGPGINDDGSGTIGILEVAKQLAKYKVNNAVRFGFWSGEEAGLLGSTYYVNNLSPAELANVRAYLNFDMIASPNYIYAIYDGDGSSFNLTGPPGSAEIEEFFEKWFAGAGQNFTATEFSGRSDYQAFIDNGIPAGGTFTGAEEIKTPEDAGKFGGTAGIATDPNYHQAGDTVDNLNRTAFELNAKAIAAAVAEYATTFDGLPPKSLQKRRVSLWEKARRRVPKKGMKGSL